MNPEGKLISEWQYCKEVEKRSVARRREIEDELIKLYRINPALEGVKEIDDGAVTMKVTSRLDRKVDAAKVQELAAEHGIEHYLSTLFRWTPEINVGVWKATDQRITEALAPAITVKPGRASFSIKE
jgi:hypothetical protein